MRKVLCLFLLLTGFGLNAQEYQLSKPLVKIEGDQFFEKRTSIRCEFRLKGASIHYTLDGKEPTSSSPRYRGPIKVKWAKTIKVKAFKEGFIPSETVVHQVFRVKEKPAFVKLSPEPKPPYDAQMSETLTNLKAGSFNFRDGEWIGYNEGPVTIDVDLGRPMGKTFVTLSTLVSPGSWIMNPDRITVAFSNDGISWEGQKELKVEPVEEGDAALKQFYEVLIGRAYRYTRFVVYPIASLPDWHPGKGNAGWVFIDEVFIQE